MFNSRILLVLGLVLAVLLAESCRENDQILPPDYSGITSIEYSNHVQPLFNTSCAMAACHDRATRAAGLSLSRWEDVIRGSSHGEVIIPFRASHSLLTKLFDGSPVRRIHPRTDRQGWSHAATEFVKRWIDDGAKSDAGVVPFSNPRRRVYVPNQGEDNVAIIDIDSLVVTRYIDVGFSPARGGPHYVEANQEFWYVSLINTGQVQKFDALTNRLVRTANVHGQPALLALTPDGQKLYVSQFMSSVLNRVSVVETGPMTVRKTITVGAMPHGIRVNHRGTRLYCANMLSDDISVIDVELDEEVDRIPLAHDANPFGPAKYMPMEIAVTPNDSLILVTCSETKEVRVFDSRTHTLVDSFRVGDQPWHLQVSPNGQYCYVSNRRGNSISVIHLSMRHVMETITTSLPVYLDYPHGCDISPDGRYTFISNENLGHGYIPRYTPDFVGNVAVIDNIDQRIIKVLEVGRIPTGLSVSR